MNGTIDKEKYEAIMTDVMPEGTKSSGYSMAAVAGGILLCIGIVIYAILTH